MTPFQEAVQQIAEYMKPSFDRAFALQREGRMNREQEVVFERLIDLTCTVLMRHGTEQIRRDAQDLQLADHARRLRRDGRHPETGETRVEYEQAIIRSGGAHPRTGQTRDDFEASEWGKE